MPALTWVTQHKLWTLGIGFVTLVTLIVAVITASIGGLLWRAMSRHDSVATLLLVVAVGMSIGYCLCLWIDHSLTHRKNHG